MNQHIPLDDLPSSARHLVQMIGWAAASALIKARPGVPFPVPKTIDGARYQYLLEVVGRDAAEVLRHTYGGDRLEIPNCKSALSRAVHRAMRADYDQGDYTLEDLALKYQCTPRWVSIVLKRPEVVDGETQLLLF